MAFKGKMYGVKNSSQLGRVGWFDGTFRVEFKRGGIYDYSPVSKELNDEFWASNGKGVFFANKIKKGDGINFVKVG